MLSDPQGDTPDPAVRRFVEDATGVRGLRVQRLAGGLTSSMTMWSSGDLDATRPIAVLRRWIVPGFEPEQGAVAREDAALRLLEMTDVPGPRLVATDPDGELTGAPSLLMGVCPGRVVLDPEGARSRSRLLAALLARVHAISVPSPDSSPDIPRGSDWFGPWADGEWIDDRALREAALAVASGPALEPDVVRHGDFQHFNVLWTVRAEHEEASALVDWPSITVGDAGIDVGHCALNLCLLYGAETALDFIADYESVRSVVASRRSVMRSLLDYGGRWHGDLTHQVDGRCPVPSQQRMTGQATLLIRWLL